MLCPFGFRADRPYQAPGVDIILGETWKEKTIKQLAEKKQDFNIPTMPPIPFPKTFFIGNLSIDRNISFISITMFFIWK